MGESDSEELNRYPPPSLLPSESWMAMKESPDRKKSRRFMFFFSFELIYGFTQMKWFLLVLWFYIYTETHTDKIRVDQDTHIYTHMPLLCAPSLKHDWMNKSLILKITLHSRFTMALLIINYNCRSHVSVG